MGNNTVLNALDVIEEQLAELDSKHSDLFELVAAPARVYELYKRFLTVRKYSLLYLVQKGKIQLTDHIDEWKRYERAFEVPDHYKVANSFLKANGQRLLNYSEDIFHYKQKKRPA